MKTDHHEERIAIPSPKELDFVVRHYQEGKLDTRLAIRRFRQRTGQPSTHLYAWIGSVAAIMLVLLTWSYLHKSSPTDDRQLTADLCNATFTLPDQSRIILAPHSTLSYNESQFMEQRRVELRGKAYFQVTHHEQSPFTVNTSIGCVTVLGTTFQVNATDSTGMAVDLVEGKVKFTALGKEDGILLTEGMSALLSREDSIPHPLPYPHRNATTWATHLFLFQDTPITKALEDITLYYGVQFITTDTTASLSGEFEATDTTDIRALLEQVTNTTIHILPK